MINFFNVWTLLVIFVKKCHTRITCYNLTFLRNNKLTNFNFQEGIQLIRSVIGEFTQCQSHTWLKCIAQLCWSRQLFTVFIFPQILLPIWGTSLLFPPHNPFQVAFLYRSGYCIFFCPSIGGIPGSNAWILKSGFHMLLFCWLFLVIKCPCVSLVWPIRSLLINVWFVPKPYPIGIWWLSG